MSAQPPCCQYHIRRSGPRPPAGLKQPTTVPANPASASAALRPSLRSRAISPRHNGAELGRGAPTDGPEAVYVAQSCFGLRYAAAESKVAGWRPAPHGVGVGVGAPSWAAHRPARDRGHFCPQRGSEPNPASAFAALRPSRWMRTRMSAVPVRVVRGVAGPGATVCRAGRPSRLTTLALPGSFWV